MDRGLADLLGTEIRDGVNTGRLESPFKRNYTRQAYQDPIIERQQGPSLLEGRQNRSASPVMQEELQNWQQHKWDKEESQMNRDEAMSGIKNVLEKTGLGLEEFKQMISKVFEDFGEAYKEPYDE